MKMSIDRVPLGAESRRTAAIRWHVVCGAACLIVLSTAGCGNPSDDASPPPASDLYVQAESRHENGTGRFYMGREIAAIAGADRPEWLERPERQTAELPDRVVRALDLRPTDVVADIGAGTGYFTFRLSPHVPEGMVLAVDIDRTMLDLIRDRADRRGVDNVLPVLGTIKNPRLPDDSVDVALIVFTYTQFSHPLEMMTNIRKSLVAGGRVVLVEYRAEDPTIPVPPLYTIREEQARKELEAAGLRWRETRDILPQHHYMVFERPLD